MSDFEDDAMIQRQTIRRAVSRAIHAVPHYQALKVSSYPDHTSLGGEFNEEGEFESYWKYGMPIGEAPLRPE